MPTVPLLNQARQSLEIRLEPHDARLTVWRQPSDGGWYCSLDAPIGTTVVASRRIVTDSPILGRLQRDFASDLHCRSIQEDKIPGEPGKAPWGITHILSLEDG